MKFNIPKDAIKGRYIHLKNIQPLLLEYSIWKSSIEGKSVLGKSIPLYKIGFGETKILIWSQMHGNESTTTKSLLDVMKFIKEQQPIFLHNCTLYIIPILNPDGALQYTRTNANDIDLNRDANELSQPESLFLRQVFENIMPDFCFNLHDQRTIFSAGNHPKPATISFLAPASNSDKTITLTRKKSMEIISVMNAYLQKYIPNQVGRFDDSFNINCTGDMFTFLGVPTILFEAGHYPYDYQREYTREYISQAILIAIEYISKNKIAGTNYKSYFDIPENQKLFYDVIIKDDIHQTQHIGILFKECLEKSTIRFVPQIEFLRDVENWYAHQYFKSSEIEGNLQDWLKFLFN